MGNQQQLTTPLPVPITPQDFNFNPFPLPIPPDVIQLQSDTINVLTGAVKIDNFDSEYQEKIRNYWRFSATCKNKNSINPVAIRTNDTLDII